MSLPDELIRLIKAEIARQITHANMLSIGGISGKGGNTVITGVGDVLIRTLGGHKAYYNGVEIGTGTYLPLVAGSSSPLTGGLYLKANSYVGTGVYLVNDVNGNLELHVQSGLAIKIVVG